jgi:hypothetical protein
VGITRKDRAQPALPKLVLIFFIVMYVPNFFIVMYVPFSVFCVLFMCNCTVLLPPGVNPIAVICTCICIVSYLQCYLLRLYSMGGQLDELREVNLGQK